MTITSKDGTQLAYTQTGSGPAVLLVGGAMQTKADHLFGALIPLLAKHFTVVSYDRRGRGESTEHEPYTVEEEIEDIEALLQQLGQDVYLFGNSSGGTLALLAAARIHTLKKVATYEAPFIPVTTHEADTYLANLRHAVETNKNGDAVALFLAKVGMPKPMIAMLKLSPMWSGMKPLAPSLIHDAQITGNGSVPSNLSQITAPVLLIHGANPAMKAAAQSAARVIPASAIQELAGQSHDVKPEALADALAAYFTAKS